MAIALEFAVRAPGATPGALLAVISAVQPLRLLLESGFDLRAFEEPVPNEGFERGFPNVGHGHREF